MALKSRSFWITVLVVSVMAVAAIVGVVVGLTHSTPAPVLHVCWEGSQATYERTCPDEVLWPSDQRPITVLPLNPDGLTPLTSDDQFARAVSSAAKSLNTELRLPLYTLVLNQGSVAVQEVPYERGMGDEAGSVRHSRDDNGRLYASVKIRSGLDMPTLHEVIRHELLHVVGMAHEDYESSTMFPITPEMILSDQLSQRHVSDITIRAVRSRYGRD